MDDGDYEAEWCYGGGPATRERVWAVEHHSIGFSICLAYRDRELRWRDNDTGKEIDVVCWTGLLCPIRPAG